ncbi:MAG: amidase [Rhizobiaceae bacterium]|nr:amidase [Rhizobiaceae bacterium]
MIASTIADLSEGLAAGRTTSRQLLEKCLAQIESQDGEGARVFLSFDATRARAEADLYDHLRDLGKSVGPLAGIPVSIKDLFDQAGEVTTAGSIALRQAPPAAHDAPAIARLRQAGFVIIGRTNMTEFAFSGLGINPHYGTPSNPFDRARKRVPGGSSSGAAVSITDGMAHAAIGTDTGGSCRIPAALCGIVGYKPTQSRVPRNGIVPLASSLDSVGTLGHSVACCATVLDVLAGGIGLTVPPRPLATTRLGIPLSLVRTEMESYVGSSFESALRCLSQAGAQLIELPFSGIESLRSINEVGSFPTIEAYAYHRKLLAAGSSSYDPRVKSRILKGAKVNAAVYLDLLSARESLIASAATEFLGVDALVLPTVPIVAPPLAELEDEDRYDRTNLTLVHNASVINFLDGCAISVPIHRRGEAPVGLTFAALAGNDPTIISIAAAAEAAFSSLRQL